MTRYHENRARLTRSVDTLHGVGKSRLASLARKGIRSVDDLLFFIPRTYEDRRTSVSVSQLRDGERALVIGEIVSARTARYAASRRTAFEMVVRDESGSVCAKWFHFSRPHMEGAYRKGQRVVLYGTAHRFRGRMEFIHPEVEVFDGADNDTAGIGRIVPVYSAVEGISQKQMRRILSGALTAYSGTVESFIPSDILERRGVLPVETALRALHSPVQDPAVGGLPGGASIHEASLIFDEFFFLELGLALRRKYTSGRQGIAFKEQAGLFQQFATGLPFALTEAQRRVIGEIARDMARPQPMHRLVQGDVGSGKTVVAFAAAMTAVGNGFQAAFMAPTEILAGQHYDSFRAMARRIPVRTHLLTGSMSAAAKKKVCAEVAHGDPCLVIGTHALIQQNVVLGRLGLIVVDEQHRFGVLQRAALQKKGPCPDVLVMTATPIPRTLSMTLYGDLDVSTVDELPRGRKPVRTKVCGERARSRVYEMVRRELAGGGQAYVICPLVEESETLDLLNATKMAQQLQREVFREYAVGLLHGRLRAEEKEAVISGFKRGDLQVLVATTVVEVGVDVPNATVMVVEHAERFGLSQLHQLRGRVGRGQKESYCILMGQGSGDSVSGRRLRVMEETTDGFRIAEEDLKIRGPGDFLGTRQSGLPELTTANIVRDVRILAAAREEAFRLADEDPDLSLPPHRVLREIVKDRWARGLSLAEVG